MKIFKKAPYPNRRQIRSQKIKAVFSLKNTWGTIISTVLMVCSFVVSYLINNTWVSNVLISVGAGFLTGIILYILSNIRNNQMIQIQNEITILKAVWKPLDDINHCEIALARSNGSENKDYAEIVYQSLMEVGSLEVTLDNSKIFRKIEPLWDQLLNRDLVNEYMDKYKKICEPGRYYLWTEDIANKLMPLTDLVKSLLDEQERRLLEIQHKVF